MLVTSGSASRRRMMQNISPFALLTISARPPVLAELNSIYKLHSALRQDPDLQQRFDRIFEVKSKKASLVIPHEFEAKVRELFAAYPGGVEKLDFVSSQTVVTTRNRFSEEYSMFNEVRRYRPGYMEKPSADQEKMIQHAIADAEGVEKCDFCSMKRTSVDSFGRIESQHCYTASNVAKYEQWHGLLVSRSHNPTAMSAAMMQDYLATAHEWFRRVNKLDREARFPHIMFDAGKKASASQIHQHMQMILTQDRYLSKTELSRLAAEKYEDEHHSNYWQEVAAIHEAIGLAVRVGGDTTILSYVTPVKEREMIIVTDDSKSASFGKGIAAAIGALTEDLGCRSFSMAITLTPLDAKTGDVTKSPFPAMARIIDRGSPLDMRSDVGAMEFYGANNVGADPFHVIPFLKKRV